MHQNLSVNVVSKVMLKFLQKYDPRPTPLRYINLFNWNITYSYSIASLTYSGIVEYFREPAIGIFPPQLPDVEEALPVDEGDQVPYRHVVYRDGFADERRSDGNVRRPVHGQAFLTSSL